METEIILYKKKPRKSRKVRISKLTGEPIISHQKAHRELWKAFSLFIRQRDKMCVQWETGACQGHLTAGHVIPRGKKAVRYAEDNVFGQCGFHNKLHHYQPYIYNAWYVKTYGADKFTELVRRSLVPTKDLSTSEAQRLTKYYQEKLGA